MFVVFSNAKNSSKSRGLNSIFLNPLISIFSFDVINVGIEGIGYEKS